MDFKKIIIKNFSFLTYVTLIIGTLLFFYAFYFSDKDFKIKTIIDNIKDPMLYLCLLFSFLSSLFLHWVIGGLKKSPNN